MEREIAFGIAVIISLVFAKILSLYAKQNRKKQLKLQAKNNEVELLRVWRMSCLNPKFKKEITAFENYEIYWVNLPNKTIDLHTKDKIIKYGNLEKELTEYELKRCVMLFKENYYIKGEEQKRNEDKEALIKTFGIEILKR